MKGEAVLLMIFLHFFNQMHKLSCELFIYIGNMSFVYWLSAVINPVSFFFPVTVCILSMFGRKVGILIDRAELLNCICIGWMILVLFTIPSFVYNGSYYTDYPQDVNNYTAFKTSWYAEG